MNLSCGVPQRREKRLGNGVKNLSGSADIPKWRIMIITAKEMLPANDWLWTNLKLCAKI